MSFDRNDAYIDRHTGPNHQMELTIERLATIIPGARFRVLVSSYRGEHDVEEVELSEIVAVDAAEARFAYDEGEAR